MFGKPELLAPPTEKREHMDVTTCGALSEVVLVKNTNWDTTLSCATSRSLKSPTTDEEGWLGSYERNVVHPHKAKQSNVSLNNGVSHMSVSIKGLQNIDVKYGGWQMVQPQNKKEVLHIMAGRVS